MLKRVEITEWKKSPVSEALLKTIKEHCLAIEEQIKEGIIEGPPLDTQNIHVYSKLAGQHLAFMEIINTHDFLSNELDDITEEF